MDMTVVEGYCVQKWTHKKKAPFFSKKEDPQTNLLTFNLLIKPYLIFPAGLLIPNLRFLLAHDWLLPAPHI